jgi:hypothetical protein
LRRGFNDNHDEDQKLLQLLVYRLVSRITRVKLYDVRALEELQYNRRGHDGTNAELNEGALASGHYGAVVTEKIH